MLFELTHKWPAEIFADAFERVRNSLAWQVSYVCRLATFLATRSPLHFSTRWNEKKLSIKTLTHLIFRTQIQLKAETNWNEKRRKKKFWIMKLTRFVSWVSIIKLWTCFSALLSSSLRDTTATRRAVQPAPWRTKERNILRFQPSIFFGSEKTKLNLSKKSRSKHKLIFMNYSSGEGWKTISIQTKVNDFTNCVIETPQLFRKIHEMKNLWNERKHSNALLRFLLVPAQNQWERL